MLKALMLRQIMMKDKDRKVFISTAEEREAVDQKFKTYVDDAVGFVNGSYARNLRRELKEYCEMDSEKPRYSPFLASLNENLLQSRKWKSRDDAINEGDIIFAMNGEAVIESSSYDSVKQKPALVCLLAKSFESSNKDNRHGFKACMSHAKKLKGDVKKLDSKDVAPITWGDILQSWELEVKGKINSKIRTDFKAEEFLGRDGEESDDEPTGASTSQARGVKRKRGSLSSSSKKFKAAQTNPPVESVTLKEIQCAFYGIERLRHSMDITHSMSVLLSDENMTLYWYDSQGCIEADTIDIIDELPLLVVMIRIFEDFPLGMWGYTPIDVWAEDEDQTKVHYGHREKPRGSFQIIGRRTFTADATKITVQTASSPSPSVNPACLDNGQSSFREEPSYDTLSQDEQLEEALFLKSAWPGTKRRKEPEVIIEAYKRAKELLGVEAQSVTDHLPVLVNFNELAYTSTEIIRRLTKSPTMDGFRVQLWMLSKKLQPIQALDPSQFWTAYWHTLRCHALLWRIGIAHVDVSLHNLMYKEHNKYGVLNDFDLATIMEFGNSIPNSQGLERMGTLPFMAMELLENEGFEGKIPRRYDHNLESFSWILVWVSRCVLGRQEYPPPFRLRQWLGNNNDTVYLSKLAFMREKGRIPMTSDYESLGVIADSWIDMWDRYLSRTPSFTKTDTEHLQTLIALCNDRAEEDALAAVPIDVTWIDGLADLKFTGPVDLPTAPAASSVVDPQLSLEHVDVSASE